MTTQDERQCILQPNMLIIFSCGEAIEYVPFLGSPHCLQTADLHHNSQSVFKQ